MTSVNHESRRGVRSRAALALLAAGAMWACTPADGEEAQGNDSSGAAGAFAGARVINVEVTPVVRSAFTDFVRITGEVEALHDVTISAQETGVINDFYVEKGARVRRGAAIAKIDDAVLRSQVEEAEAIARLAQEQYERQRRLWEDERVGSEIVFLQAKSGWEVAAARAAVFQARLERTVIRSPVDGIFDEDYIEVGEMVSPGTPVVRVVSTGRVKITGGVPERFALSVEPGDSAQVDLDVLRGMEFVGRIHFVGTSVDASNRTIPIEIILENPDRALKPRMVANVRVERERLNDVIVVSQESVIRTENGYQVFVVAVEGSVSIARGRPVVLGPSFADRVVIAEGLADGEALITLGHRIVDDGSRVRVVSGEGVDR